MNKYIILFVLLILFILFIKNNKINDDVEYFSSKKLDVAIIVEPRKHKYLVPVVLNFIEKLSDDVKIQIFHGNKNLEYIKSNFEKYIENGKIILTNLKVDNLDINQYSDLLKVQNFGII